MTRGLLLVALAALPLAGCGGSGRPACPAGGTAPVERGTQPGTRYLTSVAVTRTACGDRVAFAFEHGVPGYRVEYRSAKDARTEDASGRQIPVAGGAFLVVRLADAATARTDGGTLARTYAGPRRVAAGAAAHVREVVKTGDFEAVVTWAIGLDGKRPFAVAEDDGTLAIDVR